MVFPINQIAKSIKHKKTRFFYPIFPIYRKLQNTTSPQGECPFHSPDINDVFFFSILTDAFFPFAIVSTQILVASTYRPKEDNGLFL